MMPRDGEFGSTTDSFATATEARKKQPPVPTGMIFRVRHKPGYLLGFTFRRPSMNGAPAKAPTSCQSKSQRRSRRSGLPLLNVHDAGGSRPAATHSTKPGSSPNHREGRSEEHTSE